MFKTTYTTPDTVARRHGFSLKYSTVLMVWSLDYAVDGEALNITIDPVMMRRIASNLVWALRAKRDDMYISYSEDAVERDRSGKIKDVSKGLLFWSIATPKHTNRSTVLLSITEFGQPGFLCSDRNALQDIVVLVLTDSDANLIASYDYQVKIVVEDPATR